MNDDRAIPIREEILDLIRQNDGQLGWHEVAHSLGADESAEDAEVFLELRALERLGAIRRDASDGAIRFWIAVKDSGSK
jgi:Fe2+ or Zn2+ uptake regulation protein